MARAAVIPADSSPKRASRTTKRTTAKTTTARSATSGVTKPASRTRTTKAGASSQSKRSARSTPTPTIDRDTEEETDDEIGVIEQRPKVTKPKPRGRPPTASSTVTGRGRKVAAPSSAAVDDDSDEDELAQVEEVPKKQPGRPKTKQISKEEEVPKPQPGPRPRGRPKGSTNKAAKSTLEKETSLNTRGKAGADAASAKSGHKEVIITTNSTVMKSNLLRGPAKKKKVTFQDLSDAEEMAEPCPPAGRRRGPASGRQEGLAAKPSRNTTSAPARGRKPAGTGKNATKPLSPKKATQVAKSLSSYVSSDGEDDELSNNKSPIKLVVQSPQKHGSENTGLGSPVKRINFASIQSPKNVDENGQPVPRPRRSIDFNDTAFMSSPARRPTPSPFNYTIKETPRRAGIALRDIAKPIAQPDFTPIQDSPLKSSPKKANLGTTPRLGGLTFHDDKTMPQPTIAPGPNSPLKSSPKKGIFGSSFVQNTDDSTPFKSRSLLMSPAKKIASPFKSSLLGKSCPLPSIPQSATPQKDVPGKVDIDATQESRLESVECHEQSEFDENSDVQSAAEEDNGPNCEDPTPRNEQYDHDIFAEIDNTLFETQETGVVDDQPEHVEEFDEERNHPATETAQSDPIELKDVDDNCDHHGYERDGRESRIATDEDMNIQEEVDVIEGNAPPVEPDTDYVDDEVYAVPEDIPQTTEDNHEATENVETMDTEPEDTIFEGHDASAVALHVDIEQQVSPHLLREEHLNGPEPNLDFEDAKTPPGSPFSQSLADGLEDPFTDVSATPAALVITPQKKDHEGSADGDRRLQMGKNRSSSICGITAEDTVRVSDQTNYGASEPQAIEPYEVQERRDSIASQKLQYCLPPAPSPPRSTEYRDPEEHMVSLIDDAESEAENSVSSTTHLDYEPSPLPETTIQDQRERRRSSGPRFTLLAEQLNGWKASSPDKSQKSRPRKRGMFSLVGNLKRPSDVFTATSEVTYPALTLEQPPFSVDSPAQNDQPEDDGPKIFEDQHAEPGSIQNDMQENEQPSRPPLFEIFSDPQVDIFEGGMEHTPASSSKGNSPVNHPPSLHEVPSEEEKENQNILLPAPTTPAKSLDNQMRTFHTVSKVPLKPEGQLSPLKMPRKRGRSLSMTSPVRSSPRIRNIIASRQQSPAPSPSPRPQRVATPRLQPGDNSRIRRSGSQHTRPIRATSRSPSPSKTPGRNINACGQVLRGAVVYVDVHTTEGEDASGIFVELLNQMGARCVKNWGWNPRASLCPLEEHEPKEGRIGITHVVYKDGGVRTLEKVRQARGVVKCVGVGWVLDCERENKWLDETHYAVDSTIIPRGGAKRRKSMEPRALSNVNGTLVKTTVSSPSASGRRSGADWDTMENFMRLTPPPREESSSSTTPESSRKFHPGHTEGDQGYCQTPKTPGSSAYDFANLDKIGMSPATPFYLSQRSRLVQQTCPAKQIRQGLFSTPSQRPEPSQPLRARLEAARRKSLAFKPRIGSPLIE
ncbi:hypothetical protein BDV59DRAFT_151969 [Aspergillus ambiguus]|uniref:uncharacterized protein n=1 Tax=Aspergillus ambiguus TaxID=176160 RepID=UPI003CCE05EE